MPATVAAPLAEPPATTLALVRLMQLSSPTLPVGAYTYSQGLEWAIEAGWVRNEADVLDWIGSLLETSLAQFECPLLAALMHFWRAGDDAEVARLNADFVASRESAELRAETLQMGWSLAKLLGELDAFAALPGWRDRLRALEEPSFPCAWAAAAAAWEVAPESALAAYLWAWSENQVMAALKAVPLGQRAGQAVLAALGTRIPPLARHALTLPENAWCNYNPGLALASSRHETQYTRLFRS